LTTEDEQALAHTYDVFFFGGRDGKTVKARITWGDGRRKRVEAKNLFDLMIEIRCAIVASERE